jgi:hypothetical protein
MELRSNPKRLIIETQNTLIRPCRYPEVCPICPQPIDPNSVAYAASFLSTMVCCDSCHQWYHTACVNCTFDDATGADNWFCTFHGCTFEVPLAKLGSNKSGSHMGWRRRDVGGTYEEPCCLLACLVVSLSSISVSATTRATSAYREFAELYPRSLCLPKLLTEYNVTPFRRMVINLLERGGLHRQAIRSLQSTDVWLGDDVLSAVCTLFHIRSHVWAGQVPSALRDQLHSGWQFPIEPFVAGDGFADDCTVMVLYNVSNGHWQLLEE